MQPQATMENLPKEVILEILLRLPYKSLMRFKCVSISWLSLISDPFFTKLQFQRSSSQHTHRVLYRVNSQIQSRDINASLHDDSAVVKVNFPPSMPPAGLEILGYCRGIFLLLHREEEKLLLWDLSTAICNQIPLPVSQGFLVLYCFCYNESTDDYMLVLVTFYGFGSILGFEVFSMRSNSWEKLALSYQFYSYNAGFQLFGSILNSAIHWLIWHHETPQSPREAKIIAFAITTNSLREVPTPNNVNLDLSYFGVLGGCLFLTEKKTDEIKMWVMREYGEKSSWTNLISLSLAGRAMNHLLPLCFTKDGQLVVAYDFVGLSKWSDKGELLEHRQYCPNSFLCYIQ